MLGELAHDLCAHSVGEADGKLREGQADGGAQPQGSDVSVDNLRG
jgi:hypothetical protein